METYSDLVRRLLQIIENTNIRGNHWLVKWLGSFLLPPPPDHGLPIKTEFGFVLWVNPRLDHTLQTELYYSGAYEKGVLRWMAQWLRSGDHFVDVGANIGLMSVHAARCVGREGMVWSFEPHPDNYEALLKNITLNGLGDRITSFQQALGATNTRGALYVPAKGSNGMAGIADNGGDILIDNLIIKPLYALLPTLPRLIKIDVEGYELPVLLGAEPLLRRENPPAVVVECSRTRANPTGGPEAIWAFFKQIPVYQAFKLRHGKSRYGHLVPVRGPEDLPEHDNLFFIPVSS